MTYTLHMPSSLCSSLNVGSLVEEVLVHRGGFSALPETQYMKKAVWLRPLSGVKDVPNPAGIQNHAYGDRFLLMVLKCLI